MYSENKSILLNLIAETHSIGSSFSFLFLEKMKYFHQLPLFRNKIYSQVLVTTPTI